MSVFVFFLIAFVVTSVCFFRFYRLPQSVRRLYPRRGSAAFNNGELRVYPPASPRRWVNKQLLRKTWAE